MVWIIVAILSYLVGATIAYNEGYKDALQDMKEFIIIEESEEN